MAQQSDDLRWSYNPVDSRSFAGKHLIRCPKEQFKVDFQENTQLSIRQNVIDNLPWPTQETVRLGDVVIRRGSPATLGPSIVVEYITNDERTKIDIRWDAEKQDLHITVPAAGPSGRSPPILHIRVTVWVPHHSVLGTIQIHVDHLSIRFLRDLCLRVLGEARLSSKSGIIAAHSAGLESSDYQEQKDTLLVECPFGSFKFISQTVTATTETGYITGKWPAEESLKFFTINGHIHVVPLPTRCKKPFSIQVETVDGSAFVHHDEEVGPGGIPPRGSPPRDYRCQITSEGGNIGGFVLLGSSSSFQTETGGISIGARPYPIPRLTGDDVGGVNEQFAKLDSFSRYGNTWVRVYPRLKRSKARPSPTEPLSATGEAQTGLLNSDSSTRVELQIPQPRSSPSTMFSTLKSKHTSVEDKIKFKISDLVWKGEVFVEDGGTADRLVKGFELREWDSGENISGLSGHYVFCNDESREDWDIVTVTSERGDITVEVGWDSIMTGDRQAAYLESLHTK